MRSLRSIISFRRADSLGDQIREYQRSCASGEAGLEAFWNRQRQSRHGSTQTLAALIKVDLRRRFDRGERPRVYEYLERFPTLRKDDDQVVSLVYEEFCLRIDHGETLDSQEFCDHYEPWRDSLMSQLAYHRDFATSVGHQSTQSNFPECGEAFGKYVLKESLGQGATARVYLATEVDLWDREVVIKVSDSFDQESKIMSKLDHPNIVPILTIERSDSGRSGICMPYRPGITLEKLVEWLGSGRRPDSARTLWSILQLGKERDRASPENRPPGWLTYPFDGTYSEAIAWIGLTLARALGYLHGQGVLHRDIKPANILLAFGGGPMLLDFNLAQNPSTMQNMAISARGGTLPYMAPEHLHAFLQSSGWKFVDHLADIYSLGLVLRELLTGLRPDFPQSTSSLSRAIQELILKRYHPKTPARQINPLIPPSLDSIVEKCLAFEPSERYRTADDLAEDLQQFLDRRPLKYAENGSTAEVGANWIYRNRPIAALITLIAVSLMVFLLAFRNQTIPDRADFQKAERQLGSNRPADWEEACRVLRELHRLRPDSAWPTVYLALGIERQNPTQRDEIDRLMKEARDRLDVERALVKGLKSRPGSASLLMNYGLWLLDADRDGEAWNLIRRSLAQDSLQIAALSDFIELERTKEANERILNLCRKSVTLWNELKFEPRGISPIRQVMIPILARMVEDDLNQNSRGPANLKSARYLDELEVVLNDLHGVNSIENGPGSVETDRFTVPFYRGVIASGRGFLASEASEQETARRLFDEAELRFDAARSEIPEDSVTFIRAIDRERKILVMRRVRFGLQARAVSAAGK